MEPQSSAPRSQNLAIPMAIVVAGALIAGAVYFSGGSGSGAAQAPSVNIKDVSVTADTPYIGKKDAPVTLAYWFDYQCPFCKTVEVGGIPEIPIEPSFPMLIEEYVNTGKLRILFKDFAFLGEDSTTGALYKHAVWEAYPERFYDWHEAMFKAQDEENGGFGGEESILALTRTIPGLDAARLQGLVEKNRAKYLEAIEKDRSEGASFGINGTPGSITGKTLISGADSPSVFKAAIDSQLK